MNKFIANYDAVAQSIAAKWPMPKLIQKVIGKDVGSICCEILVMLCIDVYIPLASVLHKALIHDVLVDDKLPIRHACYDETESSVMIKPTFDYRILTAVIAAHARVLTSRPNKFSYHARSYEHGIIIDVHNHTWNKVSLITRIITEVASDRICVKKHGNLTHAYCEYEFAP